MTNDEINQPDTQRRRLLIATSAAGGIAAAATAVPFVASMTPSERARAVGSPVTADLSKLQAGEMMTVSWRGQPVWILHRTPQMLDGLAKLDRELLDPNSERAQQPEYCRNTFRSREPAYLVAVGLCTRSKLPPGGGPKRSGAHLERWLFLPMPRVAL